MPSSGGRENRRVRGQRQRPGARGLRLHRQRPQLGGGVPRPRVLAGLRQSTNSLNISSTYFGAFSIVGRPIFEGSRPTVSQPSDEELGYYGRTTPGKYWYKLRQVQL